jgi:acetyl-CoA carboxylase biotin carboxyl carrier protein
MKRRPPEKRRGAASAAAPATRTPGYDDILAIARLIESGSRFTEFRLRSGDIEVEVKRANGAVLPTTLPPPPPKGGEAAQPMPDLPAGTHVIRSPMVGTFYRAPQPGAKPFVEKGTRVKPDSIVCIIEVMKLMNSVAAGVKGTVTHIFVDNATLVEPGQALVAIGPEPE